MVWAFGLAEFGAITVQVAIVLMVASYLKHGSSYVLARSSTEADYQVLNYSLLSFTMICILAIPSLHFSSLVTPYTVSSVLVLVCIFEGLLRLLAEFFRGSTTVLRFLYFVLGDFGFKISMSLSTLLIYSYKSEVQILEMYLKFILMFILIRASILTFVIVRYLIHQSIPTKVTELKQNIPNTNFIIGLKQYWATVGMSVLSETGSATILAIFLSRIQTLAGLEIVGLVRICTQIVSVLNTPTSIIEGYISPIVKVVTKNGVDFSRLRDVRYYLITINLFILIFSLISVLTADITNHSHIVTQTFVFTLILLLIATLFRSILGAPFFILLSLGNQIGRSYKASVLGLITTLLGIMIADQLEYIIIFYAINLFIVDLIISLHFTFSKKCDNTFDADYFSFLNLINYMKIYPRFVKNITIRHFFNTIRGVRD
jgi:hypothetical protein